MTHQEFESLTGTTVTAEEYSNIEMVYMADDRIGKQEFCNMWVNTPEPAQDMMIKMATKNHYYELDAKMAIKTMHDEKMVLVDIMFESTQKMSDPDLREACIREMGIKKYLSRMLEEGRSLWAADKDALMDILDAE